MKSTNNKNLWIVPIYGIVYLIMFFGLENRTATYQVIHSSLDDRIPFCEYFIVPYVLWFLFMAVTVIYFMFCSVSITEYRKMVSMLGTGMTVFLIVSYVFPNCHHLRPVLPEDGNIFLEAVRLLYAIDTSTNLLPSIHVFNTLACFAAISHNDRCRTNKAIFYGSGVLSLLIILSTVFLKQHSVIDVSFAFILFGICYWLFYYLIPENQNHFDEIMNWNEIVTTPNILSLLRLFLGILFWGISSGADFAGKHTVLIVTLLLSGIFDFLDGRIAKKHHMVSEFGKILHPIVDMVTQGVLLLYFINKYSMVQLTLFLFLIKEGSMLLASSRIVSLTGKHESTKWFEKVSSAMFYIVAITLMVFPKVPLTTADLLIGLCDFCLINACILYMNDYITANNTARGKIHWSA